MFDAIHFVSIDVLDSQRALEFYRDKLGWEVTTDVPMGDDPAGERWIELTIPGARTYAVLYDASDSPDRIQNGLGNLVFATSDIKATHAELAGRGVEFTVEPRLESWGRWWAQFKDSEGNEFGISQVEQGDT